MKRVQGGIAGWLGHPASSRDVAGVSRSSDPFSGVASFLDAKPLGWDVIMPSELSDSSDPDELAHEFADFMRLDRVDARASVDFALDELEPANPDPVFQEQLRRRLWRLHLLTRPSSRFDGH